MSYLGIFDDYENNFLYSPSNNDNGIIPSFFSDFQDIKDANQQNENNMQSKVQDYFDVNNDVQDYLKEDKSIHPFELHNMPLDEGNDLNFDNLEPGQNDEDNYCKKISNEENKNRENSSTKITSKNGKNEIVKGKKFKTEKKQKSLPSYWRFDMVKKHWKSNINDYGKDIINKEIKASDLPNELKKLIHKPDSLKFTANVTVSDNCDFLKLSLREIFTLGKESGKLPRQNDENITGIFNYFENIGHNNLSESMKRIKSFFEMTYEDLIKSFYDSDKFIEFKNHEYTKFYDDGTIKQEGFSLLEQYGLVNLFKMLEKKRSRTK